MTGNEYTDHTHTTKDVDDCGGVWFFVSEDGEVSSSNLRLTEDVDDDGSCLSVGRAADVGAGVRDATVFNNEHTDENSRLDLLGDDDPSVCVRAHLAAVLVPVDAVRRLRATRSVAHQLDRTVRLYVLRPRHLDCCNIPISDVMSSAQFRENFPYPLI